jgi:hypothetical protein
MGYFHAEGDCVSRSGGGMAKAGVGGNQSARERRGRKNGGIARSLGIAGTPVELAEQWRIGHVQHSIRCAALPGFIGSPYI